MTLEEFIENSNKKSVPLLKTGIAKNLDEVFIDIIEPTLPKDDIIEGWNELLMKYIEHPDAVFFIRRYASAPNKNWNLIRRGFLTEHSCGFKYVFCDNYLAHYFYLMALKNFVPSLKELIFMMKTRTFPYGYMKTSAEAPYQAFPKGRPVYINRSGWKLAHLYSVNQNDYNFNYKKVSNQLFPRGEQEDWKFHGSNDYPSRYISKAIEPNIKDVAIAHFLRLVHPINYFLVPKIKLSNMDIGEKPELISYMRQKTYIKFPTILSNYEVLIKGRSPDVFNKNIIDLNFMYGENIRKNRQTNSKTCSDNKKGIKTNRTFELNYSEQDLQIIKAYLVQGYSYRTIEKEILEIESPARGGGFVAKKILNAYGVEGKHKKSITNSNIDEKIISSSNILKQTLTELRKSLLFT
jgi:hypothetical protein